MNSNRNSGTQPIKTMPVFNNWDAVAHGWYIACRSRDLPTKNPVKSVDLCGQRIAIFRGRDGKVRAMDAYCPHMGTDLGIGRVDGNALRCFFHHWAFDGEGKCVDIPCQPKDAKIPERARLQSYAVEERYGFIWVYPSAQAPGKRVDFPELEVEGASSLLYRYAKPYERTCHHHVTMINGIDPQHLRTVHRIPIEMQLTSREDDGSGEAGRIADFALKGELPSQTASERLARNLVGANYEYTMRYLDGSVGCLTMAKGTKLPELRMVFAYAPTKKGRTWVQPIFLAPRGRGFLGRIKAEFTLFLTRCAFMLLQGEDGKVYDHMRFFPGSLLPIDAPVAKFIAYVNRLPLSSWRLSD